MVVFHLSSAYVCNTVFTNEQGQIIYKTNTPFRFGTRTTTIYKIKPNGGRSDKRDQFSVMGEIEWHIFSPPKFRFGGTEVATKNFIPTRSFIKQQRVFTGPDGRTYCWDSKYGVVVLSRDDGSHAEVARSHRATLGIIGKKRKASLEVSSKVVNIMDTVIMTFIYVEKLRMDSEQAANAAITSSAAAACGAAASCC